MDVIIINSNNNKPHYQALRFNTFIPNIYSYKGTLYSQELQDNLLRYESEKIKML